MKILVHGQVEQTIANNNTPFTLIDCRTSGIQYDILKNKIGLNLVPSACEYIEIGNAPITLFLAQEKVDPRTFCHKLIHKISNEEVYIMFGILIKELYKIFDFNRKITGCK